MSFCRYCGTEITYKRTKNERWMPCNLLTGEPHFCREGNTGTKTGIIPCPICGKATFSGKGGLMDYETLMLHQCKKGNITRYEKYLERQNKLNAAKDKEPKKNKQIKTNKQSSENNRNTAVRKRKNKNARK